MAQRVLTKKYGFNGGEWSGEAIARDDLEKYASALGTCLNALPLRLGGVTRFPGTNYIGDVGGASRMEGILFSDTDKYLFVFRNTIVDIYQNDALYQSLVTPWLEADLFEFDYAHALDTIVVAHGDYTPRRIYRDSSNVFHIEDLTDTANEIHIENIPLTLGNVFEYRPSTFYAEKWHMVPDGASVSYPYVYEVTRQGTTGTDSTKTFTNTIGNTTQENSDGTGARFTNVGLKTTFSVWTTALGYPRTVTFFENRLVFGGSKTYPNRLWLSRSGDFFNFNLGFAGAGDAIDTEILSDEYEGIAWVYGGRNLVIGTTSGEWASIQENPVTPSDFYIRRQTGIGSARRSPVEIDGSVIHITTEKNEIQGMLYTRAEQAYVHDPITLLNPDAVTGVEQLAVNTSRTEDEANLLWVLNGDGTLAVLNTLRSQEVLAWCRRTFSDAVEGVASLGDDTYFIVENDFGVGVYADDVYASGVYAEDGTGSRALVKLSGDAYTDLTYTSTEDPASVTHTGFFHLAGATVQVVADGSYVGTQTIGVDGVITLGAAATTCAAGLTVPTPTVETLPPSVNTAMGSATHLPKRYVKSLIEVYQTRALVVDGKVQNFRTATSDVNEPPPLTTGIKEVRHRGWSRQPTISLTMPDPMPCTILSMTSEVAY